MSHRKHPVRYPVPLLHKDVYSVPGRIPGPGSAPLRPDPAELSVPAAHAPVSTMNNGYPAEDLPGIPGIPGIICWEEGSGDSVQHYIVLKA